MTYIRVAWKHHHPDEPVMLYSELNDDRFEVRKVEVFPDGHYGWASATASTDETKLGIVAVPQVSEIGKNPAFDPVEITESEFEEIWARCPKL